MRTRSPSTPPAELWRIVLSIVLLIAAGAGCDRIEAARTSFSLPASASGSDDGASSAETRPGSSGDMQSIGPESAQRVYYQFVDDRGRVQFVERLSEVPAAWRDQVGYVEMEQPPPLSPEEARRSWQVSSERATEIMLAAHTGRAGGARDGVILYSATWCGYCTKARRHLDSEGIQYELRDVDIPAVAQELREKTGRGGVPVLDFDGEILRGYSADHYEQAIRAIRG